MPLTQAEFKIKSKEAINNSAQKNFLANAKQQYTQRQSQQVNLFSNYELAKNRGAFVRWKAIENLDKYLIQLEANCIKAGIKVLWALDEEQALIEILSIISKHEIKSIILDSDSLADELNVQKQLENNPKVTLTIFSNHTSSHVQSYIRDNSSRNISLNALNVAGSNASITQAAFIAADAGAILIHDFTSQGTVKQVNSKVTIVLAGIDTILPSLNDAELILALQAGYASANGSNSLLKIITSARQDGAVLGEVYLLLIDNGRSNLLDTEQQRQSLYCIQCGACQALCPVVASIGSTGVDDVHSGPLAFASLPQWKGQKEFSYQSFSSPLCGKCNEVCPVKIDFRKAILATRHDTVKNKYNSQQEKLFYFFWKKTMLKREFINWNSLNAHRKAVETIFLKSKSGLRKLPLTEQKSFNQQWREHLGIK